MLIFSVCTSITSPHTPLASDLYSPIGMTQELSLTQIFKPQKERKKKRINRNFEGVSCSGSNMCGLGTYIHIEELSKTQSK